MRNYSRYLNYLKRSQPIPEKFNISRLGILPLADVSSKASLPPSLVPPEFNPKDWLTCLLHIDAELEHSLMVQYLYAAYSLGGPQVDEKDKGTIRRWQELILGIAKEEMGHFVCVQNVLRLIGAPLNFNRQEFPWDSELYPFEFKLEPFNKQSLAKYIYAESPAGWLDSPDSDPEIIEIKKELKELLAADKLGDPISELFQRILEILEHPTLIPDDIFSPETFPYQARFDEWGRGYSGGARGNTSQGSPPGTPNVLVTALSSRFDAINAMREVGEQGEAADSDDTALSHFERFLGIYQEWRKMPVSFQPSRNLATNPVAESGDGGIEQEVIENPEGKIWASLFNVRYRMLLAFLTHTFYIDGGFDNGTHSARGAIIHASFGEMYNLRSIATALVSMPLEDRSSKFCGPPFQVPYTMDLPIGESNRWQFHIDMMEASEALVNRLKETGNQLYLTYLNGLMQADNMLKEQFEKIITATV